MKLQKFSIYAKHPEKVQDLAARVEQQGFQWSQDAPDFVITLGGDGTFLAAERTLPGVPKLLVRDSLVCYKCQNEPLDEMLALLQEDRGCIEEIIKLEVTHSDSQLLAVNDAILRNENLTQAIRFTVHESSKGIDVQAIGDGIVVATAFGATGYYRSVTRSAFSQGIGLAFNNPTEEQPPRILDESIELTVTLTRGIGQLAVDNNPDIRQVEAGDRLTIRKASQVARLVSYL
ncbi:MAG: hypothetical protein ACFB8W_15610 [Elainellaceae cyanobacterium]